MPTLGPLELLEALDDELLAGLETTFSLRKFLARRVADWLPRRDTTTLRVGSLTLPETVIALGNTNLSVPLHVTLPDGSTLPDEESQRLQRPLQELSQQLAFTAVDDAIGFWRTRRWPGTALPALQGLAGNLAQRLHAQLALRKNDQSLDSASLHLMERALAGTGEGLRVRTLSLQLETEAAPLALPGVYVIGQDEADPVLLHSLAFGVERFVSLARLERELRERLDDPRQGSALLAPLTSEQRLLAHTAQALKIEAITGDWLSHFARSIRDWHMLHLRKAWALRPAGLDLDALERYLQQHAQLPTLLHRRGPLQTRYALLLARHMLPWFKNTADNQKVNALQAIRELILAMALARSPALPTAHSFSQRPALLAYTAERLRRAMAVDLGRDIDPLRVMISTTKALRTGALLHPLNPSSYIAGQLRDKTGELITLVTHRRNLAELALENVSLLDLDFSLTARVSLDGAPAPRGLTAAKVKRLVRELSVGSSYARFVEQRLLHGPDAQWRRERYRHLASARMRYEAYKSNASRRFLDHPQQRGFAWACALLDHPNANDRHTPVLGDTLQIHQLLVQEATISGVLIIAATQDQAPFNVVVYTPAAPDRRAWREYTSRQAFIHAFAADPALLQYLVNRASLAQQANVKRILGGQRGGAHLRLAPIHGDFLDQCYSAEVRHVIANVRAQALSTSRLDAQAFAQLGLSVLELMASLAPPPVPLLVALARALGTLWEGLEALPERDIALQHFMGSITYLGEASISLAGSSTFAKSFRSLPLQPPRVLNDAMAVSRESQHLRYRIDGIYSEGVYETLGEDGAAAEYFIEDRAGRRYKIEFDGHYWNVIDARHPEAYTPARVRKNSRGDYEIVSDLYWEGALPDLARLLSEARLAAPPEGLSADRRGFATLDGELYLKLQANWYQVRKSLLRGRYRLVLPQSDGIRYPATALLRRDASDRHWQIRVRQSGTNSAWLPLPALP